MTKYYIEKYGADGQAGPEDEYVIQSGIPSLRKARAIVRRELGVKRLSATRRWAGIGATIEAYHDFPASHPRAYGCGGLAIIPE